MARSRSTAGTLMTKVTEAAGSLRAALGRRRSPEPDRGAGAETWTCDCGARYRSTGAGRHRVVWAADAAEGDPVLGDRCPECDRPLAAA